MTSNNTILNKINELYLKSGYMDKYGKDVWITVILCIVFIIVICYQYLINTLEVVKADWPNFRCNPLFMPFAGLINKPTDQSSLEYTVMNFSECIMAILRFVAENAFKPFQLVMIILNDTIQALVDSVNKIRGLIDKLRNDYAYIFDQIYAAITNLVVAFINFTIKMKDTMLKTNSLLTTALYSLFGAYMAMQSLFLSMLDLMVIILIAIACFILIFICLAVGFWPVPIVGQAIAATPIVIATTTAVIMLAILIPVVWFIIMMLRVLNLSSPPAPGVPSCFAGSTLIPLFEKDSKCIKDIQLGDKLKNGGIVTATMKFTSTDQNMYILNGVLVTGEHRVFHPTLNWIKVKNHPDSRYTPSFNEPYIYCLNTDNKEIVIADTLFSDWDDIDTKVVSDLQKNCVDHDYLPENFTYTDIHACLETGLHPNTTVTLNNGFMIPIDEIEINDHLDDNGRVLGIIKVQGKDIEHYKHYFNNEKFLCGSQNIHINDGSLGIINCMDIESARTPSTPILYHLLTDSKFFIANNIRINDYNYGIDAYSN
jgi:hypothetical protein